MKSNCYNKEIRINEENERIHVRNVLFIQNGHLKNYKRMKKSQTYHGGLVNKQAWVQVKVLYFPVVQYSVIGKISPNLRLSSAAWL